MPVNVCLVFTAFAPNLEAAVALSLVGSVLAQMDARPRASYVMAVVTPGECAAAASVTAVSCSLAERPKPHAGRFTPRHAGFGWPLVIAAD